MIGWIVQHKAIRFILMNSWIVDYFEFINSLHSFIAYFIYSFMIFTWVLHGRDRFIEYSEGVVVTYNYKALEFSYHIYNSFLLHFGFQTLI